MNPPKKLIVKKISPTAEPSLTQTVPSAPKLTPSIKPKPMQTLVESNQPDDDTVSNLTDVDEIYKDLELREQIYMAPDTYIGGTDVDTRDMWLVDDHSDCMVLEKVDYVPGLYKIFDEVLVNAIDQHVRIRENIKYRDLIKAGKAKPTPEVPSGDIPYRPIKSIKVSVSPIDFRITVENDGDGVDVEIHKKLGIYVPQMIFSKLLTSSNYNTGVKRIVGGKNGYGAKLANIFSTEFTIETVDAYRKRRYKQTFRNNMTVIEAPEIEENYKKVPFTRISFIPDLKRFKLSELSTHMIRIMKKRAYDAAAFTEGANVYWNDSKIEIKSFERYVDMYIGGKAETKRHYAQPDPRWEVVACASKDHNFAQVSMVNGICTTRGGKHVEYIANQITKKLSDHINSKKKGTNLKPQDIKNNLFLFLKCTLENPSFDTQSKEFVTSLVSDFGSKCNIDDDFITKLAKTDIGDRAIALSNFKEGEKFKETPGNKRNKVSNEKLEDASYAGGTKSSQCTLILTEGDSAKTFAMSGLKALTEEQRKYYGVFPLRGKLLNVRDATAKKINDNEEIVALKNIIGLQLGKDYLNSNHSLRYGTILIITDQDDDGLHIKGLLFNFFHNFWPSILQRNTSIKAMNTPLIRVWKEKKKGLSKAKDPSSMQSFYSEQDYKAWRTAHKGEKGWKYKYYKGLGTNSSTEAVECFNNLKVVNYLWDTNTVSTADLNGQNSSSTSNSTNVSDTEASDVENEEEPNEDQDEEPAGAGSLFVTKTKKGKGKHIVVDGMNYTDYALNLAFKKGFEEARKNWIQNYNQTDTYDFNIQEETYPDFVNKRLVSFSYEDCVRSIPSVCDGLKPGQRKIIFSVQKKKQTSDIKVAQLAGYVAEHTDYHHGEASLNSTIIGLAQDYVSSNNINLLYPSGMFGTRMGGSPGSSKTGLGKDFASPRYIYTRQSDVMPFLFKESDNPLYEYLKSDNLYIEPKYYLPILPMILINGSAGIGTGYSTKLPCYNPLHLIENIKQLMEDKPPIKMTPWYRGFRGEINEKTSNTYTSHGVYRAVGADTLEIIDLPISNSMSFMQYKKFLLSIVSNTINLNREKKEKKNKHALTGKIIDVEFDITDKTFKATVTFAPGELGQMMAVPSKFEKDMKLVTTINCTNMYLFNHKGSLQKYNSTAEILKEYYAVRLEKYVQRKAYLLEELSLKYEKVSAKAQFIRDIHDTRIIINENVNNKNKPKKKSEIEEQLVTLKYPKFGANRRINPGLAGHSTKEGEGKGDGEGEGDDEVVDDEDLSDMNIVKDEATGEPKSDVAKADNGNYDYLLSMRIDSLTEEMLLELEKERDITFDKLTTLKGKTPQNLWSDDLDEFKAMYLQSLDTWHEEYDIKKSESNNKLVKKVTSYIKNPLPPPKKVLITKKTITAV